MASQNRPRASDNFGVTTANPPALSASLQEERKASDDWIKQVLDLHGPPDGSQTYETDVDPLKIPLKRQQIINEGDCLLRNCSLELESLKRNHGEVQVIFYDYNVRNTQYDDFEDEDDDDDDDDDEGNDLRREQKYEERRKRMMKNNKQKNQAGGDQDMYQVVPLQYLYKKPDLPLSPVEMDYDFFQSGVGEPSLRVIEFPACYYATDFLKSIHRHGPRSTVVEHGEVDPRAVLKSKNLQSNKQGTIDFKTGVSLQASPSPDGEYLTLFISMPYFGKPPTEKFERNPRFTHPDSDHAINLTEYRPVERDWWRRESLSLSEYRYLGPSGHDSGREPGKYKKICEELKNEDVKKQEILVHQAWFMVLDNYTMAMFRSADDQPSDQNPRQPPLYPYQEKIGAFRALAHYISNTLDCSERTLFDTYCAKTSELEFDYKDIINRDNAINEEFNSEQASHQGTEAEETETPAGSIKQSTGWKLGAQRRNYEKQEAEKEQKKRDKINLRMERKHRREMRITEEKMRNRLHDDKKELTLNAEKAVIEISTMTNIVRSQIQILRELREIFQISINSRSRRSHGGTVRIPVMSDQREQIRAAESTLGAIIQERETFSEKLDILFKDVKKTQKSLSQFLAKDTVSETGRRTTEEIERQANTMSMFTLVTTVFLPLGFLASYAAMEPAKKKFRTEADFWKICAPITGVFVIITFFIILHKKGRTERLLLRAEDWLVGLFAKKGASTTVMAPSATVTDVEAQK